MATEVIVNYQHWHGFNDKRFGYGRHVMGFVEHLPPGVILNPKASVSVYMGLPMAVKGFYKGQWRVNFTMYESTELSDWFKRYVPLYDQIIVPCDHNVELFGRYHKNVVKVQEGVDRTVFYPRDVPRLERFQFRAGGSLWRRKGLDVLVQVFNRLALPDADLRIKAAPHAMDVPKGDLGPNIYLDREWMTDDEQCNWFAEADCFVAPSRGEGWGLIPLQTISMGIPTIVSNTSGQLEFAHLATGRVNCSKQRGDMPGFWDEPDQDELAEQMLDHYRNYETKKREAAINAELSSQFSWQAASEQLVRAVPHGELLDTEYFEDFTAHLQVIALRDIDASIGKYRIRQRRGEVFTVADGPYQVLFDNGAVKIHEPS